MKNRKMRAIAMMTGVFAAAVMMAGFSGRALAAETEAKESGAAVTVTDM